jgi:hypothetical protein
VVRHNDLTVSTYPIKGLADAQQVAIDPRPALPLRDRGLAVNGHILIEVAGVDDARAWPGSLSMPVKAPKALEENIGWAGIGDQEIGVDIKRLLSPP